MAKINGGPLDGAERDWWTPLMFVMMPKVVLRKREARFQADKRLAVYDREPDGSYQFRGIVFQGDANLVG